MRLVLDTNVVVSALIARGVPRELFLLGRRRNQMIRLGGRLAVVVEPEAGADLGVRLLGGNCARSARDRAAGR